MATLFDHENQEYDYELVVPGDPRPQARPRTRIIQPKTGITELIRNLKARIAIIGSPREPEDWSAEIRQMNEVLRAVAKKAFATIYEDSKSRKAKEHIVKVLRDQAPRKLIDTALRVDLFFYLPRPGNHYGTGRNEGIIKQIFAYIFHIKKPDKDNLTKLALDALTGIYWRDDSIICQGWSQKEYSNTPRTEIKIKIL